MLGEDQLTIDANIKDTSATGNEGEIGDDVLIVGQEVVGRAHGASGIVSRDAIGDGDSILLFRHEASLIVGRISRLPVIAGKRAAVYCTYALKASWTLEKLSAVVSRLGGEVIGGATIRRGQIEASSTEVVNHLVGTLSFSPLEPADQPIGEKASLILN